MAGNKNSGKVAQWRFNVSPGTLFTGAQTQKNSIAVVSPVASGYEFATSTKLFTTAS
jgi:hypothetical protein